MPGARILPVGLSLATPNELLDAMLAQREPRQLAYAEDIVPHIFFHHDPDAVVEARLIPGESPGSVTVAVAAEGRPTWVSLNIRLVGIEPKALSHLGIFVHAKSTEVHTLGVVLRVVNTAGFDDRFFRKRVVTYPEASDHVDLLDLAELDPPEASRYELILFFEQPEAEITFESLKLFGL